MAPEEAARQLLNFAESRYPEYFPSPQASQSLAPFVYRHYPQTGVYVGVVVTPGLGYEHLGVYVMGGPFGAQPQLVGPLAAFITPVNPGSGPGPTGVSNGCFDQQFALAETPGNRWVITERTESAPVQQWTYDWRVVGPTTFEGHAVTDHILNFVQGDYPNGIPESVLQGSVGHIYTRRTGAAELTHYGETNTVNRTQTTSAGSISITTTSNSQSKSVYEPPWIDQEASLPLGGSLTRTTRLRTVTTATTTTTGGLNIPPIVVGPTESVGESTTRVTFLRRERVTVPAGTFDACVYENEIAGNRGLLWVADGRGFQLKMQGTVGVATTVSVTTSIRLNGQAVTQ